MLQEWDGQEDVVYSRVLVKAGEPVTCVQDGLPTWVSEVMATRASLAEAVDFVVRVRPCCPPHAACLSSHLRSRPRTAPWPEPRTSWSGGASCDLLHTVCSVCAGARMLHSQLCMPDTCASQQQTRSHGHPAAMRSEHSLGACTTD